MAEPRAHPAPARLPTLTEVMQEGRGVPALRRVSEAAAPPVPERAAEAAAAADPGGTPVDEARIVEAVLSGLQQRVDLMLEYRLREALAPLLARATDAILQEARVELAHTLRDVVARAVGQELARRRLR
ncbi:MAG: hypothetical protein AMXMBFR78_34950 [Rubrivivax sp.]